jgi:hypothetical protein
MMMGGFSAMGFGFRGALDRLWDDVVGSKLYITGSTASDQFYGQLSNLHRIRKKRRSIRGDPRRTLCPEVGKPHHPGRDTSEPRELDRTSVYRAVDRRSQAYWGERIRGVDLAMPRSWNILYQEGEEWKEVETDVQLPCITRKAPCIGVLCRPTYAACVVSA